ncbi:MAG: sigma 54-interacting transcriptional regulator [Lachnospiraceae bacterium]|nr:sigma 54-interacting transcriptional regulator [Lachnospiraceae bacterium]
MDASFYSMILDGLSDPLYVLDSRGNYVFVNSAYCNQLRIPGRELLKMNVHDFLKTGQITECLFDLVVRQKGQIIRFQDVMDTMNTGRPKFRQLVVMTPFFDENAEIRYVLATLRPVDQINRDFYIASLESTAAAKTVLANYTVEQGNIVVESPVMKHILSVAQDISETDATVLITGESGTGKEVVARYIHSCSNRKKGQMVIINCASLPETLLEAELFGYEKGAFTGAAPGGKRGLFEEADKGTLFLDEINSLPLSLQGKLLRAIETKTIQRIGAYKSRSVDFRLIVTTNEDLQQLVEQKRFRADLYYRINVIPIRIPPLRERREDILPMADLFLKEFCRKNGKEKSFSPQMLDNMVHYDWPGNVRELKNFVERSVLLSTEQYIKIPNIGGVFEAIPGITVRQDIRKSEFVESRIEEMLEQGMSLEDYMEDCEKSVLEWAIAKYGSSYKTAAALKTSQASVMRKKKKYGL